MSSSNPERPGRWWVWIVGLCASVGVLVWLSWPAERTSSPVAPTQTTQAPQPRASSHADASPAEALPSPPLEELERDAIAERDVVESVEMLELTGIVTDEWTGEPLFDFELAAWVQHVARGSIANVRTDERGRFSFAPIPTDRSPNKLGFTLIDHPSIPRAPNQAVVLERVDGKFPLPATLSPYVGPTIAFELSYPPELSAADFRVQLVSGPPRPGRIAHDPARSELREPIDFGPHPGLPWVRFARPPYQKDRAWVELRSADAAWRGGAWITQFHGVLPEPVPIQLVGATSLVCRFIWPTNVEQDWAYLRLARLEDGVVSGKAIHGFAKETGEARFEFLEPGRHRLWTWDKNWEPFEIEFDVHPGENDIGEHTLVPRAVVGTVSGVLRSTSGRFEGACHVSLSDVAGEHDALYDHSIDFEPIDPENEEGELVAAFEFEDVTEGEWWLYVHCHDGYAFPGSVVRVRAPTESLEILLDDRSLSVRVELVEAETGAPCETAEFDWTCGEADDRVTGAEVTIESLPDAPERLRWFAGAEDRVFASGTGLDFERRQLENGSVELVGKIALAQGFGRHVIARVQGEATLLAGVEVFCDDELVGRTGADGSLAVVRSTKPARITLSKPGWIHVSSSDFNATTGNYGYHTVLHAQFEPEAH